MIQSNAFLTKDGFEYVRIIDVIYIKSFGNFCNPTLVKGRLKKPIHLFKSLKYMEKILKKDDYIRSHHEYLIKLFHMIRNIKGDL